MKLFGAVLWHNSDQPNLLDVRRCNIVFARYKCIRHTCKHLCYFQTFGGISSVQWQKVGRIWGLQLLFHRFLCVRIQIDQLLWVNCWVIIHCLEVSNKQINHLRFMLVIWSPLPPNSELLLDNSLLELICFVIMIVIKISMLEIKSINFHICSLLQPLSSKNSPNVRYHENIQYQIHVHVPY